MITLKRTRHDNYTLGVLTMPDDTEMCALELPWRDNRIGKSCIPEGRYIVDRNKTGRHQWYSLRNKETTPRTFIEIHPANTLNQLEGCIAPCLDITLIAGEPVTVKSKIACEYLLDWFGDNSFVLEITS